MSALELTEVNAYPEIYADGIGDIQNLGVNARMLYFTWQRIEGVFRAVPTVAIIRPIASLAAHHAMVVAVTLQEAAPQLEAITNLMH